MAGYGDTHAFQPWQIRELVLFLRPVLDENQAWCLGHHLLHLGVISAEEGNGAAAGAGACLDFDDADGLWRQLCLATVRFAGKWAEVMDRTLAHARRTDQSVSFLYEMCFVCARDGDAAMTRVEADLIAHMKVDTAVLVQFARLGVRERAARSPGKRKIADRAGEDRAGEDRAVREVLAALDAAVGDPDPRKRPSR